MHADIIAREFRLIHFHALLCCCSPFSFSLVDVVSGDGQFQWYLDSLKASDSPDPMMKRMGVPLIQRKLAASTKLEATYRLLRNSKVLQPSSHHIGFDLHRMSATLGR
jgi:hypothetical protein